MQYIGMNFIQNSFYPTRADFPSLNPSTGEAIGYFPQNQEHVGLAVKAARDAFPLWAALSRVQRAEYFWKLAKLLEEKKDVFARAISLETGKSLNESMAEVIEALHMAQFCFGKGKEPCGDVIASELPERDLYVIRKPKGVVAVIAPWNFPFAIGGFWCACPALLEGNTVVLKPSELTPMVGQMTAELFAEANFPGGVFNLVHGDGEIGAALVRDDVDHIAFTGSAEVGKEIRMECARSWHKTCSCEMGSKSAVMVFDDCDLDLAVSACVNSAFKLTGQRCVSAGRLLVQESILEKFKEYFLYEVGCVYVSDPFVKVPVGVCSVACGPLISLEQRNRVAHYNDLVRADKDAKILYDVTGTYAVPERGYFLPPFVYQVNWADKPYLKQEVFGPHVAIIPFRDLNDAIRIYNDTKYGLALGVITTDFKKAREVRNKCDYGLGYWNGGSIAAESHSVFGGVKASGNGWPSAAGMFDAVVHKVAWSVNHGQLTFPQGLK